MPRSGAAIMLLMAASLKVEKATRTWATMDSHSWTLLRLSQLRNGIATIAGL